MYLLFPPSSLKCLLMHFKDAQTRSKSYRACRENMTEDEMSLATRGDSNIMDGEAAPDTATPRGLSC